ncbi:polyhomeotic-like protein 3 isoform X2 [Ctenopharyngodon idella]|nr:polyhomeotic-like protein 3 isoform X2 [Ctenopharyngodon idella]XP_051737927.1 polyhomeotic-like protein 3 isoform X2 [Ctenopharyngodon idella]XP_051737929.1 polyhomeotic-like protein 3 isoform X2 [Ctenopharyngodon idella]
MDKEPQTKAEPAKSTVNTTTTTTVNPSHQANGTPKTPPALTTVTTFHNQPTPTNRKVVQVNLSGDRLAPSFSPSERVNQASSSQQTPKTVSLPAGSTPLVRGNQNPIAATAARKISPQALLLGKSPNTSQAQMLLRAQMLILTSAVRPDVPALSSSSSFSSSSSSTPSSSSPRFPSTQLQSLTLRPPPPGTLTIPPNLPLKATTSSQPPPLSCPRLATFHLRPSQPANAPGKDGATKTESPTSQTVQTKATPVRHLTVPPPSLYAPAQAHALAKQKLNSSGLKRPHSQISIPQHPFNQRHTPPNSPPATPKKPLPELKRCPSTQPSQSVSAQSASVPITVPSPARSHLTPPTLTLPLRSSSPGGSLLATKQLLRIALSSASAQCTNGQSKTATVSPPHDLIQSKPLVSPALAKPECPAQPLRTPNPCPQLVQLSPSRQTTAATPLITTPPLASPQRASPPSPVLPLVSTSSILAPPQSPLTSQSPTQTAETSKDTKDRKEEQKEEDVPDQTPQDLKCPAPQKKITPAVAVDQPSSETSEKVLNKMTVCTEDSRTDSQMKTPQKNETQSPSVAPWPAEKDDQCEETSTQSDNHSAISSLSSDMSPIQSSITQPLDVPPVLSSFSPEILTFLKAKQPVQPPTVSQTITTEVQQPSGAAKPLVLTHLVEGFIIQEGLEPFPVSRSSLMVGPVRESGVNGVRESELIPSSSEPPEDSTDSDDEDVVTNNGVGRAHKLVLQCQFCKRKGTAQTFPRSKRFCSKSCAKRFSYTKRFRALRRCVSEGGHRSELNGAEENFHQAKHGTTEQWRILQQPPQEGEDGTAAPMKTRLRRHTEQEREREIRVRQTVQETRSAPTSPIDPVSPTDVSPYPKPAQWSVDQVSSFISNLPGCQDIAESFRAQEIDGQALLLLTEDHLMSALNVKLGPALKICARINSLKEGGR